VKTTHSQKLLADYVRTGSEATFRELLTRYTDLVYSAAVRLLGGDTHLAKDVTQTVFVDFARKARKVPKDVMLGGWLHQHTVFVARTVMRGERRRQLRERQAVEMISLQDHTETNLAQIAPILDEAIYELNAEDRNAILLRFFEQFDFRSLGEMLNSNEEAARKRVTRALEKLHLFLKRRGVTLSAAALGTALTTEAVMAAPADLAANLVATALAASATSGTTIPFFRMIAAMKLKAGIAVALVVAGVTTPLLVQHQAQRKLNQQDELLQRKGSQLSQVAAENARLSNLLAKAASSSITRDELSELLRLRGEVGRLRDVEKELEKLRQQNGRLASENTQSPSQEQMIYVGGEVLNPGRFLWTNGMSLSSVIELAHGFTDFADRSVVRIKQPASELYSTINYGGRSVAGSFLRPGVMIHVPRSITNQPTDPPILEPEQR